MKSLSSFLLPLLLLLALTVPATAQTSAKANSKAKGQPTAAAPRIRIVFIGSVHFTPSKTDMYKNDAMDLKSAQRQPQVKAVVEKLAAFHPDQICVEWPATKQAKLDSLFRAYQAGKYELESDEFDQFAMRTAARLKLSGLTAVNYYGNFDMDTVTAFAKAHQQEALLARLDQASTEIMAQLNENGRKLALDQYLKYLNSPELLNANASFYSRVARIGDGADYRGVGLVSEWYDTNLHIYANILRRIRPTDKAIVVIYGQGHVPILKSLFATNPDFEVVEVKDVL